MAKEAALAGALNNELGPILHALQEAVNGNDEEYRNAESSFRTSYRRISWHLNALKGLLCK